jgi:hypothetical protein
MKRLATPTFIAVLLALVLPAAPASAGPILYSQATNIGGDVWRYDYILSYDSFGPLAQNQGIAILFAYDQYQNLQDETPPLSDWYTGVLERDVILGVPVDGEFDALALVGDPTIPLAFSVSFEWLGPGATPGAQPFVAYDFNSDPASVLAEGVTTMIPEPGTLVLLGLGLVGLVRSRSKH